MKALKTLVTLGSLVVSPLSIASSVFDGTWRPDPEVYSPTREPDVVELANGAYRCQSCTPPFSIKADGSAQSIAGNEYYDGLSVEIVDERQIRKVAKKGTNPVFESDVSVSADGKTQTERRTLHFLSAHPIEFTTHSIRLSAGAPGAHLVSGSWRMTDGDVSNHVEDTDFKIVGDTLEMSDRSGRSFSAKLDGSDAPYKGSEQFTSVSLKRIDSHTIEESDKKDGHVVKISLWSILADGKTMHVRFEDTHGHIQEQTGHKVQ